MRLQADRRRHWSPAAGPWAGAPAQAGLSLNGLHHRGGTTKRVNVGPKGAQADSEGADPSISADGRFVAFDSDATNLIHGDTNGAEDVFVRDLQAGTTVRASVGAGGA